ncbi:MAG: hypothetical protein AAF467_25500 [Actinomycetota bacterium]
MATITRSTPNPKVTAAVNPIVKFFIRRGWGMVARRLMVLHWNGRKSGQAYSTPVSRYELDGRLFTQTRAGFRHNFVGGHPAELVVDGERRPVVGTLVDAPDLVAQRMRDVLAEMGPDQGSQALGVKIDGTPTIDDLTRYVTDEGVALLDFTAA